MIPAFPADSPSEKAGSSPLAGRARADRDGQGLRGMARSPWTAFRTEI